MKKTLFATASLAATVTMLPATASALDYVVAGGTVTSEYTSQGAQLSDGLSFQPYIEAGIGNFYFGAYAATADENFAGYGVEYAPYFGYRSSVGNFSYDAALYFPPIGDKPPAFSRSASANLVMISPPEI